MISSTALITTRSTVSLPINPRIIINRNHHICPSLPTQTVPFSGRRVRGHPLFHPVKATMASSSAEEVKRELYPPIEPYSSGFLKVSDLHTVYWEQSGNPSGHPVVFLHGGPGAGTSPNNRRFFDPEFYRIILFDQRGAGKSTPHACLEENTTWDLIKDIEKLREHLDIPKWQVKITTRFAFKTFLVGFNVISFLRKNAAGVWRIVGKHVTGLVLRGIFLLRKKELDWFYEGGAAAIFPDAWESFRDFIPENERDNFISAYDKRLNSDDLQTQAFARIENHYFVNRGFFPRESFLLDNIEKIRHIRTVIVQGRYDVCCPMMSAWDLHKAWPEAEFKVVPNAGHSANEPAVGAELVAANEMHKNFLKSG
ncbi:Proline iminopeptidase [Acorus calamus]|uniref:prolyl aminopeptidase n=1 Tax=Acorus calamus TaxID=4465 RepID=A0AAV9CXG7_ACOCL|nr:Proline iminopeptidase [Acorus calamus]